MNFGNLAKVSGSSRQIWQPCRLLSNIVTNCIIHCKDKTTKIINKYDQKRNCAASVPISTFVCLWAIHILPQSICLFCCRKICGPILGIYKSLLVFIAISLNANHWTFDVLWFVRSYIYACMPRRINSGVHLQAGRIVFVMSHFVGLYKCTVEYCPTCKQYVLVPI
jgi:hypothetical protein